MPPPANGPRFNENARQALTDADVRFTTKGKALYAFVMGVPQKEAVVKALGLASPQAPGKILNVELLGHKRKLDWKQDDGSLTVQMPAQSPSDHVVAFKIARA